MKLSIGVKALNEEKHIEQCLRTALNAAAPFEGEVVLADSGSIDRTVDIAMSLPVRIVQPRNLAERRCGLGAQMAFQASSGDYFYMLDGDMALEPGFMAKAVAYLDANPSVAGVGGRVVEANTQGREFQIRSHTTQSDANWLPGPVDRLDCGGLYRSSAIRDVGYFADRNLHAFEELELAARLESRGWTLARIDEVALKHYGHTQNSYRLLLKRLKSGYSWAPGEVLKSAWSRRHLSVIMRRFSHIRLGLAVNLWWIALLVTVVLSLKSPLWLIGLLGLLIAPFGFLVMRRRSLALGLYSFASWNVSALGLVIGLFRSRKSPMDMIDISVVKPASGGGQAVSEESA